MPKGVYERTLGRKYKKRRMVDPVVRFWPKVRINEESGCFEWTAANNGLGYGVFSIDGKNVYAHRFAFELVNGPIPEGLDLDHLCRNPSCVRTVHLRAVTHRENCLAPGVMSPPALQSRQTHCRRAGHELVGENLIASELPKRKCRTCANERRRKKAAA